MANDGSLPRDPGQRREAKIQQYKREKELRQQISVSSYSTYIADLRRKAVDIQIHLLPPSHSSSPSFLPPRIDRQSSPIPVPRLL